MIPNALPHRFQRLEARAVLRGVQPHTFGGAVIDHPEDRDLAVGQGDRSRRIRAHITLGRVVTMVPSWGRGRRPRGQPRGAEQVGGAHDDQRSTFRRAQALRSQARQILRCPSPWNGLAAITARIAAVSSASDWGGLGPRLAHGVGRARRSVARRPSSAAPATRA